MMQHTQWFNSHQNTDHIWTLQDFFHKFPVVVINKCWLNIILTGIQFLKNH